MVTALTFACQGAEEVVGCVKSASGGAIVARGGQDLPAKAGMHLWPNDVLRTAA